MRTTVVNINTERMFDVYIGRGSKWGNPYKIGVDGTRDQVIKKYERYAVEKGLDKQAQSLRGKILGCHCDPEPCHGHLLAKWADQ